MTAAELAQFFYERWFRCHRRLQVSQPPFRSGWARARERYWQAFFLADKAIRLLAAKEVR